MRRPKRQLNDKTMSLQIAWAEHDYLLGLSRRSGLSMSALLREIVKAFIAKEAPSQVLGRLED